MRFFLIRLLFNTQTISAASGSAGVRGRQRAAVCRGLRQKRRGGGRLVILSHSHSNLCFKWLMAESLYTIDAFIRTAESVWEKQKQGGFQRRNSNLGDDVRRLAFVLPFYQLHIRTEHYIFRIDDIDSNVCLCFLQHLLVTFLAYHPKKMYALYVYMY